MPGAMRCAEHEAVLLRNAGQSHDGPRRHRRGQRLAREHGIRTVVDNAFATSALQRPLEHGADVVAYAATKLMDGQGRVLAGAVSPVRLTSSTTCCCRSSATPGRRFRRSMPGWCSRGWKRWICERTGKPTMRWNVGRFLEARVPQILHPGLECHPQFDLARRQMIKPGSIFSFVIDGGRTEAHGFLDALELIDISNNIGDSKSLMTHPASTTHSSLSPETRAAMGVTEGMLRISVGLEDPQDLIDDLDRALRKVGL
jgi:O-succinylhomoserine sulfhydrylase